MKRKLPFFPQSSFRTCVTFFFVVIILQLCFIRPSHLQAQDDQCLECHGERDFTTERGGKEISLYVDGKKFHDSIHGENGCVSCHEDADVEEFPHNENLAAVDCSNCHDDISEKYQKSLHGEAFKKGKYLAPNCVTCHGKHDILPHTDEKSKTYVMNVPALCGSCHKEGTPVSKLRILSQNHILENYSLSIHGNGLFQTGLIVTAVCTSCHRSHDILPPENPESSINRNNIASTCMQCHAQIEKVHLKVVRGESWEAKPHELPICVDCHQPHKVQRVFYEKSFPDSKCLSCHGKKRFKKTVDGKTISLYVDKNDLQHSVHRNNSCIKCHTNVSISKRPVCLNSGKVDCSMCHAEEVANYQTSQHGIDHANGKQNVPYCIDCHGTHNTSSKNDITSPTFARNIPDLCGKCHREGQKAAVVYTGKQHEIYKHYTMSIHGKGLIKSGLMVTATCVDCHTTHHELPASDPASSVYPDNIPKTCAQCHLGIYEKFKTSIHSKQVSKSKKKLPACNDCHQSHTIERVDIGDFRQKILNQCGKCHLDVASTYFDTFHGKVSKLGSVKTAKCYDCHGSHNILPVSNPKSTLSYYNIVETCKKCHPNSNRKFVGYLTHATHHNKTKYPYLFFTFWGMSILLIGTFGFFGLHTIMWLPRAGYERRRINKNRKDASKTAGTSFSNKIHVQRFDGFSRFLHLLVIISFLSLAISGMTIKFSGVGIFQSISRVLGGYAVTGHIHRVAALITFIYFFLHIGYMLYKKCHSKIPLKKMLTGENTLVPRKKDIVEFFQSMKWFLGIGPRPEYGRWTYWEKFDYFAVFWGVVVIGGSGLLLWFPEFFTKMGLHGWLINVATIIHSDEALLATGFIFTVHFFNTHFRPDKFPMDPVIFTGSVSLEELKHDRPFEYKQLTKDRTIREKFVDPPPRWLVSGARIFGLSCLTMGIAVIVLIIYAMLFLYR